MVALVTTALLALPVTALASFHPHGTLRRRHYDHARSVVKRDEPTNWVLNDTYDNTNFFDKFDFYTGKDQTNGIVNFVNQSFAESNGLAYYETNHVVLGVDSTTQLAENEPRNSIHITSKEKFQSGTLVLASFYAMPHGCATWPAYWQVGDDWPNQGELDIIENVNEAVSNQVTAHTGVSCTLDHSIETIGTIQGDDCFSRPDHNSGCAFVTDNNATYGHNFNMNAGGVYAHIWTSNEIKVWFFQRQQIPQDILDGQPNPNSWGTPFGAFTNGNCDIADAFKNQKIVFDITLCGDWAGPAYADSGCPGTCSQHVMDPSNFKVAKFKVEYLKIFKQN
ncbi:glycoside hydrolase family 16 protein [Abortiporus biennis]|nr:glycoside hydrolase family 16 protein [Abortiporus biennis]